MPRVIRAVCAHARPPSRRCTVLDVTAAAGILRCMTTRGSVLIPLLDGFEEIEAVTLIDVLRRAGVNVIVASEEPGPVRGSHDISVLADTALADVKIDDLAMIALPGGMPGAARLAAHPVVQRLVREAGERDRHTAAVCAGPIALGAAGVLAGKTATCYPGFEDRLTGARVVDDRVVVDGKGRHQPRTRHRARARPDPGRPARGPGPGSRAGKEHAGPARGRGPARVARAAAGFGHAVNLPPRPRACDGSLHCHARAMS